jgi:multisubunit Na+/H+ antiporter MnhB subunit
MAQSNSQVYVIGEAVSGTQDKSGFTFPTLGGGGILFVGMAVILLGIIVYLASRKKEGNFFKFFGSKGTLAVFILLGLIFTFIGGAAMFTKETTTVPDFSVTDTEGNVHTPKLTKERCW